MKSVGVGTISSALCYALLASSALAQSAQERQAAAAAFNRGTTAYLAHDYATAAQYFETANDIAPAAPALLQAIRAHRAGENDLRAVTLALRLIDAFPSADAEIAEAQGILDEVAPCFTRVEVSCDTECAVELDGTLVSHPSFFIEPGTDHRVGAAFDTGNAERTVNGEAGATLTLAFERPPALRPAQPVEHIADRAEPRPVPPARADAPPERGMGPGPFIASLIATVGAGAVLVWSGVDTQNDAEEYESVAAEERAMGMYDFPQANELLDAGQKEELRTNVLIGVTAGLGALTVLFAALTDWGGSEDDASASLGIGLGSLALQGAF